MGNGPAGSGGRRTWLRPSPALPSPGEVGPVGDHGLGDSPVLEPVAQGGGKRLPKDVLNFICVVRTHPLGVDGHPRGLGEQVGVGLGTPGEGRDHPGWQVARLEPPGPEMGPPGAREGLGIPMRLMKKRSLTPGDGNLWATFMVSWFCDLYCIDISPPQNILSHLPPIIQSQERLLFFSASESVFLM